MMMMMMMITALNIFGKTECFQIKKQGWCHIIVTVVPQGATRIVKIKKKKGKVGKMQGFKRESCSAEKCK